MKQTSLSLKQRFNLSRFFKGEAPVAGPVTLNQRRVFILPTQRGLGMVLTVIVLLLVAFIYNNNLVYFLAFLLASLFFVTILHTYRSLAGLIVQAGPVQPTFAGEQANFSLRLNNPSPLPRFDLSASLDFEQAFELEAYQSTMLSLSAATRRRGWQTMGTVTLASRYPLGIFRAWSPLRFDSRVLVYPKPGLSSLPLPTTMGQEREEDQGIVESFGHEQFNGLREYQSGDSPRRIHWKAYAKGQGLMSRLYASECAGTELWLDYAQTPGVDVEERLSQLCRWLLDAEASGMRYGLLLPGQRIECAGGASHLAVCLESLALF